MAENVGSVLLQQQENLQLFELLGRECVVRGWGTLGGVGGDMGGLMGCEESHGGAHWGPWVPWG